VDALQLKRVNDDFVMHGHYQLPADLTEASKQPADLDLSLNAPQLSDLWVTDSPDRVFGPLQLNGQFRWRDGLADGQLQASGQELKVRDLVIHQLTSNCAVSHSVVYVNDCSIVLNAHDFVNATGQLDLKGRQAYSGELVAQVADLSTLKPVLRKAGNQNELAGSLAINWTGKGELKSYQNTGSLKFNLDKGRYGDVQSIQSRIDSTYSPDSLDVPIIFLSSNKMVFQAIARAQGKTFEIEKIELTQDKSKYATGYLSIPFVWRNLGTRSELFPPGGPVSVAFQSENLELGKLFQDLGIKSSVSGVVTLKADLHGPLNRVEGGLELHARNLQSDQIKKLQPATLDFTAQTGSGQLRLSGKLQQTNIQPIELTAQVPFNLAEVLRNGGLPDDTPVTAKVRQPRSSVNFMRQFVPDVEQLDGDVAIDVDVRGTVAKPVLSGSADMTVNVARSSNVTLPALRGFKAKLNFSNDTLKVEQFGGELSGGKFTLTGGMKFHSLTSVDIDLQLKADSILVARNDAVTARANADIKVVGPLSSASVTGTVEMTNSQFLKNLDLIPIGLPGRPAPQPPSSRPEFSFPDPPVRDWKFDVSIKTKDPFLIRGNLANGGAVCDLHLVGTGLHPGLQGLIRLEKVEATLPFSRLDIAYGFLYFDPSDSLNPKMDLHGTSVIRDYTIHVYIYGSSLEPQAVFTSEPPLPQEEVISLLATGTTREELAGNNNVLASRAAMLLVQQLYRKVFKTGQGTQTSSVFDRLDVDAGQTDPRTGQQQATARFKINNHFVLVGDVEVGGSFRGMVKYLIRFR
jgi:autotransporter translocation and assembly factor TamB